MSENVAGVPLTFDDANHATDLGELVSPEFSEDNLALRFTVEHWETLCYVADWGKWMRFDGCRWQQDRTYEVYDSVRKNIRDASAQCSDKEKLTAKKLNSRQTVSAVEYLARSDRRHARESKQFDAEPWSLNTTGGYVNLITGDPRPHRETRYATKLAPVAAGGECPLWRQFLQRITAEDAELETYLQRVAGYCLTGSTREHALFFFYGVGANGKSTLVNTLLGVMGDYAQVAAMEVFCESKNDRHPTELAGMRGARLVVSSETESGRKWAESRIKSLTGGEPVRARFMHCDDFEFIPQFKLLISGNHKPGLRSVNEAIRRRLHLVPFVVTIPPEERDPDLTEKLKAEWPGILAWAIQGCLDWQRDGLNPPKAVLDATNEYLANEDKIGRWIEDRATVGKAYATSYRALYQNFKQWAEETGERVPTQKSFAQDLAERGFEREHARDGQIFLGIGLKSESLIGGQ